MWKTQVSPTLYFSTPLFFVFQLPIYALSVAQEPSCQPQAVRALIKSHVDNSDLLSSVGTELSFRLPINASAHFPAMLRQLDAQVLCCCSLCERKFTPIYIIQNGPQIINNPVGV